ncbi:MAG: hypothetical protein KAT70_03345 [Thermoplasmata archaeon]|nr:hypothetical protein [Thermoplasmata archaeon]
MGDDRRFIAGWGFVIVFGSICALLAVIDAAPALAAAGFFFILLGMGMAVLSNMGPKEKLLSGGGMGSLALGVMLAAVAYELAGPVVVLLLVVMIAGLGLIVVGLKGGK